MKYAIITLCAFMLSVSVSAKTYFVAVDGSDTNQGSIEAPFASLQKAQSLVQPGDVVYIRGGVYKITQEQIMSYSVDGVWAYVFDMQTKGTKKAPICYWGYEGERPVFDLSAVKPQGKRVMAFYVKGSYLHFKNFEVVGTQVTITGRTQSECFRNDGGNYNTYENLAMHDGMAIGFFLLKGMHNTVLNCDAYNNFENISGDGKGGNIDGFGAHPDSAGSVGNSFKGCRAWYNSGDGFDLINAFTTVTVEDCWAFYNGFEPETSNSAGEGFGFKAGGYGMDAKAKIPERIPMHVVKNCIAFNNRNHGFISNRHLGGVEFQNNTAFKNHTNYNMLNRKSIEDPVEAEGYKHVMKNNISFGPRSGKHIINIAAGKCTLVNNTFGPEEIAVTSADFVSINASELFAPRNEDGSLPEIDFLKVKKSSPLHSNGIGTKFE